MKDRTSSLIVLTIVAVAASVLAVRSHQHRLELEGRLAHFAAMRSRQLSELRRSQLAAAALVAECAQLRVALRMTQDKRSIPPDILPKASTLDAKTAAALTEIARQPWSDIVLASNLELQSRYLSMRAAERAVKFRPFWSAAGLSSEQFQQFDTLMKAADASEMDIKATMRAAGLTESDPSIVALREKAREDLRNAEQNLLGNEVYQRLQEFTRITPVWDFLGSMAAKLSYTGAPLTNSEAEQLAPIIAHATWTYHAGGQALPTAVEWEASLFDGRPAREPLDLAAVHSAAQSFLSPTQLAFLDAGLNSTVSNVRVFNLLRHHSADPVTGWVYGRR